MRCLTCYQRFNPTTPLQTECEPCLRLEPIESEVLLFVSSSPRSWTEIREWAKSARYWSSRTRYGQWRVINEDVGATLRHLIGLGRVLRSEEGQYYATASEGR